MIIASIDIAQYDCPIVRITEDIDNIKVVVLAANNSLIKEGVEKIYIKMSSDDTNMLFNAIKKINAYGMVKNLNVLGRTEKEAKLLMYIKKTRAMEATVDLDAMPLAPWVASNGYKKWILGFHNKKLLNDYLSIVKEQDIIKNILVKEVPEELIAKISLGYIPITSFIEKTNTLTDRQIDVLELSVSKGYYDWPRKSNTIELSKELGISRVAVTKLLRKAEGTILKESISLVKQLRKLEKKDKKEVML
uniref:Uncharacterized protein n=1 Tax=Fervidicoccus fontis TaxID=683846 RepID=A0A7C1HWY1_9CREN